MLKIFHLLKYSQIRAMVSWSGREIFNNPLYKVFFSIMSLEFESRHHRIFRKVLGGNPRVQCLLKIVDSVLCEKLCRWNYSEAESVHGTVAVQITNHERLCALSENLISFRYSLIWNTGELSGWWINTYVPEVSATRIV